MINITLDDYLYLYADVNLTQGQRGFTIGQINGAIASAGRKLGMLLDTKTKRHIRIALAIELLFDHIKSYNELDDGQLLALRDAISTSDGQTALAEWIKTEGYEGTPIPQQPDHESGDPEDWGDDVW